MPWKPRRPRRGHYVPILMPLLDAFDVIGVGVTKGYDLVNTGFIETVLIGRRRYATRESLERLATPVDCQGAEPLETMAQADPDRWTGRRSPRARPPGDKPGAVE
jgi:hypothetical protein